MHKYITHGSQQISGDYRVAYFLNGDRFLMWFTEQYVGEIHNVETPAAGSSSHIQVFACFSNAHKHVLLCNATESERVF